MYYCAQDTWARVRVGAQVYALLYCCCACRVLYVLRLVSVGLVGVAWMGSPPLTLPPTAVEV